MKRSWLVLLQQHPKEKKRNKGETDAFSSEAKGEKEKIMLLANSTCW